MLADKPVTVITPVAGPSAVRVTGTARGSAITGRGYLEMTGYKGSLGRVMSLTAGKP